MLIVGGGIGGTAAGIALRRAGVECTVFERAPDLQRIQVGGSYVLWYGGVMALEQLGLADKVRALGHAVERFEMCDAQGRPITAYDVGERGRAVGAVPLAVRRADLMRVLTEALEADVLQLGATFRDFVQDRDGVTATFTDGREERGGILVGADGLDSTVRAHLHDLEPPRHPGYGHWSGIAESDGGAPPGSFRVLHGNGARFGYFHLGGGRVCWWAVRNAPEGPDGDAYGTHAALTDFFRGWAPTVGAVIAATPPDTVHRRDTLDRPPMRRWGRGRVTLLGDAAHAMTFNLGQGAGTSLTDAVTLAEHLSRSPVLAALRAYEQARRAITTPLTRLSQLVGAVAALDWPLGEQVNVAFVRSGIKATPGMLERDLRGHPGLATTGRGGADVI